MCVYVCVCMSTEFCHFEPVEIHSRFSTKLWSSLFILAQVILCIVRVLLSSKSSAETPWIFSWMFQLTDILRTKMHSCSHQSHTCQHPQDVADWDNLPNGRCGRKPWCFACMVEGIVVHMDLLLQNDYHQNWGEFDWYTMIYLEPKWPLFCLEKGLFFGGPGIY